MLPRWWHRVPADWRPRLLKFGLNWFPAFRNTGGRVVHVARDLRRITLRLPLNWRTKNIVGTLFGGSLYAATDPMFPMLLALHLGRDFIVWDKAGAIRYRRPGRTDLFADFHVSAAEIDEVRAATLAAGATERVFTVELKDRHGLTHVEVDKTVYVARKEFYRDKPPR